MEEMDISKDRADQASRDQILSEVKNLLTAGELFDLGFGSNSLHRRENRITPKNLKSQKGQLPQT